MCLTGRLACVLWSRFIRHVSNMTLLWTGLRSRAVLSPVNIGTYRSFHFCYKEIYWSLKNHASYSLFQQKRTFKGTSIRKNCIPYHSTKSMKKWCYSWLQPIKTIYEVEAYDVLHNRPWELLVPLPQGGHEENRNLMCVYFGIDCTQISESREWAEAWTADLMFSYYKQAKVTVHF